jgi:hypothetical protein
MFIVSYSFYFVRGTYISEMGKNRGQQLTKYIDVCRTYFWHVRHILS